MEVCGGVEYMCVEVCGGVECMRVYGGVWRC